MWAMCQHLTVKMSSDGECGDLCSVCDDSICVTIEDFCGGCAAYVCYSCGVDCGVCNKRLCMECLGVCSECKFTFCDSNTIHCAVWDYLINERVCPGCG
jgi:hypothetical protein